MSVTIDQCLVEVRCNDPYKRSCTASTSSSVGSINSGLLLLRDWSVSLETGFAICPTCRSIPKGGGEDFGKVPNDQLMEKFAKLCIYAAPDDVNAVRCRNELLRRLALVPKLDASELQPT